MKRVTAIICISAAVASGWPAVAAELKRNPFRSPLQLVGQAIGLPLAANSGGDLELRAILVGDPHSFVNLGGQIMGVGDEVAGYKLVSVAEEHAVFLRDGEMVTLSLYSESED